MIWNAYLQTYRLIQSRYIKIIVHTSDIDSHNTFVRQNATDAELGFFARKLALQPMRTLTFEHIRWSARPWEMTSRTTLHGFAALLVHPTLANIANITCNSQTSRILERRKDFTESDESRRFRILLSIHRWTRRSLNCACDHAIAARSSLKPFKTNLIKYAQGNIWILSNLDTFLISCLEAVEIERELYVVQNKRGEESKIPRNWSG